MLTLNLFLQKFEPDLHHNNRHFQFRDNNQRNNYLDLIVQNQLFNLHQYPIPVNKENYQDFVPMLQDVLKRLLKIQ